MKSGHQENQPLQHCDTSDGNQQYHHRNRAARQMTHRERNMKRQRLLIIFTVLFLLVGLILTIIGLTLKSYQDGSSSKAGCASCDESHVANFRIVGPLFLSIGGILLIFTICSTHRTGGNFMSFSQPVQRTAACYQSNPPSTRASYQDPAQIPTPYPAHTSKPYPPSPLLQPYPTTHGQPYPPSPALHPPLHPYTPTQLYQIPQPSHLYPPSQQVTPSAPPLDPETVSPPPSYTDVIGSVGSGNVV